MKRWRTSFVIVALFALMLPLTTAAQTVIPGPSTRHISRTDGLPISGPYDIVQFLLDFAPGAWTPMHTHGGKVLVTVLEGEIVRNHAHGSDTYSKGDSWAELPDDPHEAGNNTGSPATVLVTAVLPAGAPLSTVAGDPSPNPPPGPVARYMHRVPGQPLTGPYEIVHTVLDFAPGTWTPPHSHGGVLPFTVIEGELTFHMAGHAERVIRKGESDMEHLNHVVRAGNTTSQVTTTTGSMTLPKGNTFTYVVPSMDCYFFLETKQSLCSGFQAYWDKYGGLAIFGYPISAEMKDANGVTVQWFERARFEWHPGAWPERYDVLLGRIGAELAATIGIGYTR
ncbi:MAG TPA: cupin domain-containing protein [Thermomicrobiales bacterium]|nr:cupin domain-containing protein [Thermomicrobiales bacterium]